jgi:hypothetical protein
MTCGVARVTRTCPSGARCPSQRGINHLRGRRCLLDDEREHTLREVAAELQVSESQARPDRGDRADEVRRRHGGRAGAETGTATTTSPRRAARHRPARAWPTSGTAAATIEFTPPPSTTGSAASTCASSADS